MPSPPSYIIDNGCNEHVKSPLQVRLDASRPARARQPSAHFLAGACGGLATAVLTSPLDVLRTRLQSDIYRRPQTSAIIPSRQFRDAISTVYRTEGWYGFFRGLGPAMAGVVPAATVKFYVYGNAKILGSRLLGYPEEAAIVHTQAAIAAGVATATITNPIWLVKTRLQLDRPSAGSGTTRRYKSALDCLRQVLCDEGARGLFRGLSASYLGTAETVLHLVLYERLKLICRDALDDASEGFGNARDEIKQWVGTSGAAGAAKVVAVLITYPHEVLRTRLRQAPMENGEPRYGSLLQCFRNVQKQEGFVGLYGGLVPHLLRSIPSAVISLGTYEFVLRLLGHN